jgi:hypothetical protein
LIQGNTRFSADSFTTKVEGKLLGAPSKSEERQDNFTRSLKFGAWELGTDFEFHNFQHPSLGVIRVTGYNPRGKKYRFIVTTVKGAQYKMSEDQIKNLPKVS